MRDRYASAWQCQHHDIAAVFEVFKPRRQLNASMSTVTVWLLVLEA
jgi:hypothetical protein